MSRPKQEKNGHILLLYLVIFYYRSAPVHLQRDTTNLPKRWLLLIVTPSPLNLLLR